MGRATLSILSTDNLYHNLSTLKSHASKSKIMVMLKANAYGHGIRSVALRLSGKVDNIGVASIEEALAIRDVGVNTPITLIEGVNDSNELIIASVKNFDIVFHTHNQINWLYKSYHCFRPLFAWLKIDTGMGRLGFDLEEAETQYDRLSKHPYIQKPVGIMSHFACAEDLNHGLNTQQIENFKTFTEKFPNAPKSFCNSAGIFSFPHEHFNMVRPGLCIYGISPFPKKSPFDLNLKPVMSLQTRLINVRMRKKGSYIGYGATYQCPQDMPVGVIAIGYGDGYPRSAPSGTPVFVNQTRCQIVGRISMDMITIDLSHAPDSQEGDPVELWGQNIAVEEVALFSKRSVYEVITSVAPRVKFHWSI